VPWFRTCDKLDDEPFSSLSEVVLLYDVQMQDLVPVGGDSESDVSPFFLKIGHFLFFLPKKSFFPLELLDELLPPLEYFQHVLRFLLESVFDFKGMQDVDVVASPPLLSSLSLSASCCVVPLLDW
jgi:hypothetical protein